jgi:hypothetical protein
VLNFLLNNLQVLSQLVDLLMDALLMGFKQLPSLSESAIALSP